MFARGKRILFADADGASRFSDLAGLQLAMDALLVSPSVSSDQNGHARRKSFDGVFGRRASLGELAGHGLVAGSRAHLEKSQAVVQVSWRDGLTFAMHT